MSNDESPIDAAPVADDAQGAETAAAEPLLDPVEARVLGCLMEKKYTTPNTYPLTLNALVQACNQKTSRHPVMHLEPGEVGRTLNHLRDRKLIYAEFAGRTERYDEKLSRHLLLDQQRHAVLCSLMLRGPQTTGELRINASRMAEFDDMEAVHETLEWLLSRRIPLVVKLPRLAGKREERYAHLLCGEVDEKAVAASLGGATRAPVVIPSTADDERLTALEAEVAGLRKELDLLWKLTGLQEQRPATGEDEGA